MGDGRRPVNPIHACVRGVKVSASNPGLVVLGWAAGLATALLLLVPLAALAMGAIVVLRGGGLQEAQGTGRVLEAARIVLDHWPLVLGLLMGGTLWAGLVLVGYLYVQAGLWGCAVRAHRQGPPGDMALKPRLGASSAFEVFTFRVLREEIRAHGGRVAAVATAYSLAGMALVLLFAAWAAACVWLASKGPVPLALGTAGIIIGLGGLLLLFLAGSYHYRFAVICAIERSCGWRAAVGAANGVFRASPLEALAVAGFILAARYALSAVVLLLSVPLLLLSFVPLIGVVFLLPRLFLSVAQGLASSAIGVAAAGAIAAACEPVDGDRSGEREKGRTGKNSNGVERRDAAP